VLGSVWFCTIGERVIFGITSVAHGLYNGLSFFEIAFAELCYRCLHVLVHAKVAEREHHHIPQQVCVQKEFADIVDNNPRTGDEA